MSLTVAKLAQILATSLRLVADTGDWKSAARKAADAIDPPAKPTPAPDPKPSSGPLGIDGSFKQIFVDDFSGSSVDLTKWRLGRPADAAGGHSGYAADQGEKTFYLGEQVSIRNGQLVLTATNNPLTVVKDSSKQGQLVGDTYYSPQEQGTWNYRSGTVTTGADKNGWLSAKATGGKTWTPLPPGFQFQYGVFELVAKLPDAGPGLWPAFWLLPVDGSWSFEIDAVECVDPTGHRIAQHLHANNGALDLTSNPGLGFDCTKDMTAGFHTWSIDWQPGLLRWLIDGVETQRIGTNIPNVPLYFIANLAVGGNWPKDPTAVTKFPAELIIDSVRCWQKA